ncbi:MAG: GNAT family N-acetyltransferase [Ruminococcus sp.]|nr:GNAT family N-acetyltransferase [Ruminococcus sp.]
MLRMRPYKPIDALTVAGWIKDERSFRLWSADRFRDFPLDPEELNRHYADHDNCDNFYPFTFFDGPGREGVTGHMIMRFTDEEKTALRFGFVILDDKRRGCGLGTEMVRLALSYAFLILKVHTVSLGVFEENTPALRCYLRAGFKVDESAKAEHFDIGQEKWRCKELLCSREDWERAKDE